MRESVSREKQYNHERSRVKQPQEGRKEGRKERKEGAWGAGGTREEGKEGTVSREEPRTCTSLSFTFLSAIFASDVVA